MNTEWTLNIRKYILNVLFKSDVVWRECVCVWFGLSVWVRVEIYMGTVRERNSEHKWNARNMWHVYVTNKNFDYKPYEPQMELKRTYS